MERIQLDLNPATRQIMRKDFITAVVKFEQAGKQAGKQTGKQTGKNGRAGQRNASLQPCTTRDLGPRLQF
jgi:hypothetical protein